MDRVGGKAAGGGGERIAYVDAARGLAILCVVLGHLYPGDGIVQYISSFHVPVFFILSGLLMAARDGWKTRRLTEFAAKKAKRLLYPYATISALNLALPVSDGEQIRVLTQEEAATGQAMSEVVSDSRVNINTAGKDELMTLPGIGASRADAILEYREQHGGFEDIEEIMQVPGIKEHSFEKLRENIKVGIENGEQGFSSG